jgi:uridine kinase
VLCLDDFYKDGNDPTLPSAKGIIDWESPGSWNADAAVAAIAELAATGQSNVPIYDISRSMRVADQLFKLDDQPLFMAEGIFAAEIVTRCTELGILADAMALRRPRTVTFARRLVRDLAEHRKPPPLLVRRGLQLWRNDPAILKRQAELGCRPRTAGQIWSRVARLLRAATADLRKPV